MYNKEEKMELIPTHRSIQNAVCELLQTHENSGKLMWDRLNSGSAFMPRGGGKFYKIKLCKKGTADLWVGIRGQIYFIEIKPPDKKQNKDQLEFQAKCEKQGFTYLIVRSVDDVIDFLSLNQI